MPPTTVNDFFTRGSLTFVVGTRGDDVIDERIDVQARLLRSFVATDAPVIVDTDLDVSIGPSAWPTYPLLYGGSDTNSVISSLAGSLPYEVSQQRIAIGGKEFKGDGYRLVAVTPATDRYPEFVIYAGTGRAGIAEINAGLPLGAPILIADTFGPLMTGTWKRVDGTLVAELGPPQRRIDYRRVTRELSSADGAHTAVIKFEFPAMVPRAANEDELIAACMRGLKRVVTKLNIGKPSAMSVYIYPDRRSKAQLTNNQGDGHAVPSSRALHVLAMPPAAAEQLVAHEATHVLGYFDWGPAGTPFIGEGLAVWVSGGYAGKSLDAWKSEVEFLSVSELVSPAWRTLPEARKYPLAALAFDVAVAQVGLDKVREHLMPATANTWDAACKRAGTRSEKLSEALRAMLAR